MGRWTLLETGAELTGKIQGLKKKCTRRVLTNYLLSDEDINEEIANTEFFYTEGDENTTLIKRCDDFYQMYYFIGNPDTYSLNFPMSVNYGTLVCELFEKENRERQEEIVRKFDALGLESYKKYYLWEYKEAEVIDMDEKGLTFTEKHECDVLTDLYNIFDRYSERLPLLRDSENFCAGMSQVQCWDGDKYIGAVIYSVNKNVATEEFIYIADSARGEGYARVLEGKFISYCIRELHMKRIYAWIETNNIKSVALHQSVGYLRTDQYKLTLKREPFKK